MYSYVACSFFWLAFTLLLCLIGKQLCGRKSFSECMISGYLFYSFPVAICGMIVQIFNLPWISFAIFMVILWCVLIGSIIYKTRNNAISFLNIDFKAYLQNNWVIYFVLVILVFMSLLYYAGFWLGNHQDDGYYITKVATLPYTQTGGNFMYPLGVNRVGFNSYIINTWEIEASVYVKLLNVSPTLYLRLFQSTFVFFLYLNLIKAFSEKIIKNFGLKIKESFAQLPVIIVLLFDMHYLFLSDTYLFRLRDMFMVNTGMFLGSSTVKMMGMLLLLYFYIDKEKIYWKEIVTIGAISVILMSKSTIALPVIGITAVSALIACLMLNYKKRGKCFALAILMVYVVVAIILPNNTEIQNVIWSDTTSALRSPIIWICVAIFICSFWLKNKMVYKLNIIIFIQGALIVIPQINDVFECLSIYNFVAGRAITTLLYFFVVVNVIYLVLILNRIRMNEVWIRRFYLGLAVGLAIVSIIGFKLFGGNVLLDQPRVGTSIKNALATIKNNPYFVPNSTIDLGESLNRLSEESEDMIKVVTPTVVVMEGAYHPLPVMLRIYAHDIIPVSAAVRYPTNDGSALSKYKQQYYDSFISDPSDETYSAFKEEIKDLDVNCIVVYDEECALWLEKDGYELYDTVGDNLYYIWYRE